jgi:plastocyanin
MTIVATREVRDKRNPATATRASGRDWRSIIFRGVAGLLAAALLAAFAPDLLAPWALLREATPGYTPELHRWHGADSGAFVGLLVCGSLLALIPRPRRAPLLAQFVLLGLGVLALASLRPFNGAALAIAVVVGALVAATYPAPRALLSAKREGPPGTLWVRPLLALGLAATIPLAVYAWTSARLQFSDLGEHAVNHHWMVSAAVGLALALAGLLAATRRPGWRALGVLTGIAYLYLGAAALAIPTHDGSWGVGGGILALLGGAGFVAAALLDGRRDQIRTAARSLPALLLALALGLAVAACGQPAGASGQDGDFSGEPAAQKVEVRVAPGGRLAWERSEYHANAGDVTFVVSSPAGQAHNFAVEGPGVQAQAKPFAGGTTQRYTLKGLQPGTYRIVCTLPGHREAGMVATLYVR